MIITNLETREVLNLRSVSACWNELLQRLLRLRNVHLDRERTKRADGMTLFDVFDARKDHFLPWSACVFDVSMQLMPAFYHKFLKEFGTRIKTFEVQEFATDFNLFSVLHLMPNLEQLTIPKLKKKIAHLYDENTPVLEKLSKLKFVRIFFGSNVQFNASFLEVLIEAAPALAHLEVQNLSITPASNLDNIAALLAKSPSITLSVENFEDEGFVAFKEYTLKLKKLILKFPSIMNGLELRENFLASFGCLESLDMIIWPILEANSINLKRIFPTIPALKTISINIGTWNRPEAQASGINLISTFESELFPNLAIVTVSSPRFAPIQMSRKLLKHKTLRNAIRLEIHSNF